MTTVTDITHTVLTVARNAASKSTLKLRSEPEKQTFYCASDKSISAINVTLYAKCAVVSAHKNMRFLIKSDRNIINGICSMYLKQECISQHVLQSSRH